MPYKRVLLVCGHGYGTTTMLKESLLSEYQIHIIDTIPLYKVPAFPDWTVIDYVFSTIQLNVKLPKPCILVNPILQAEDRAKIEKLDIPRKTILSSYYAIEEKLGFLDEKTRGRVMEVIERELGYRTVKPQHNPKSFSGFLKFDCIRRVDVKLEWRQAVSDGSFALLHEKGTKGIEKTSLSLLVNRQPVWFGEKQAKVIFCLASRDAKEHIPAVVTLMRMVKAIPLIKELEACRTEEEIYQTILNCEFEVL